MLSSVPPLTAFSALLCISSSVVTAAPYLEPKKVQCHCSSVSTELPSAPSTHASSASADFCAQLAPEVEQWQASSNTPVAYRQGVQRISEDGDKLSITLDPRSPHPISLVLEYPKRNNDGLIESEADEEDPVLQRNIVCRPMRPSEQLRTSIEAYNSGTLYMVKISMAVLLLMCFLDGLWIGWTRYRTRRQAAEDLTYSSGDRSESRCIDEKEALAQYLEAQDAALDADARRSDHES